MRTAAVVLISFVQIVVNYSFTNKSGQQPRQDKIMGGEKYSIKKAPYVASYGDKCAASILSDRWVLTAAHCRELDFVRVKAQNLSLGEKHSIRKYYPHENYRQNTKDYDFQLLYLKTKIKFSKKAKPARIGRSSLLKSGNMLSIFGYGRLNFKGIHSKTLMKVSVPIKTMSYCKKKYKQYNFKITDRMFCAGYSDGGKDACQGDSGGPATVKGKLVGLVSWGEGCGEPGRPGVFSNIFAVASWIEKKTKIQF